MSRAIPPQLRLFASFDDHPVDGYVLALYLDAGRIDHLLRLIGLAQITAVVDRGFEYTEYAAPHEVDGTVYLSYYDRGELRSDTPEAERTAIYDAVVLGWGVVPVKYCCTSAAAAPRNPRMCVDVESVAFLINISTDNDDYDDPLRTQPLTAVVLRKLRERLTTDEPIIETLLTWE